MRIWIDAQLSPALADWISQRYKHIEAKAVRAVDLRDAEDREIFGEARNAASDTTEIAVMSKDSDFLDLLDRHGPPPNIIWVTCGNTSNRRMKKILKQKLKSAVDLLESGEALVEISDS
jgi:predicted nuclease of predicted toxin-antitoxin system